MSLFPFREEKHIEQLYETDDIYDFIGRGTFASVYKAVSLVETDSLARGQPVALKVFNKRDLTSDKMRLDVINEVEILRRIHHPNCVGLLDYFHTPLHVVIVMNYVEGTELFKALRDGIFSLTQIRGVARQLLDALDYLHREVGIVHRDVKPENILVAPTNTNEVLHVTLVDFGLARTFDRRSRPRPRLGLSRLTPTPTPSEGVDTHSDSPLLTTPCGTLHYAAPETVRSLTQSRPLSTTPDLLPRMDAYAVGAILYVMLGGKLPFHHGGSKMQLVREMEAGPLFEEARWGNVPTAAVELTRALLQPDPARRPRAAEAREFAWFTQNAPNETETSGHNTPDVKAETIPNKTHEGDEEEERGRDDGGHWVPPMTELVGDREYIKKVFDAMKPPESAVYEGTAGGGRCISVPFSTARSSVTSYFGFCP